MPFEILEAICLAAILALGISCALLKLPSARWLLAFTHLFAVIAFLPTSLLPWIAFEHLPSYFFGALTLTGVIFTLWIVIRCHRSDSRLSTEKPIQHHSALADIDIRVRTSSDNEQPSQSSTANSIQTFLPRLAADDPAGSEARLVHSTQCVETSVHQPVQQVAIHIIRYDAITPSQSTTDPVHNRNETNSTTCDSKKSGIVVVVEKNHRIGAGGLSHAPFDHILRKIGENAPAMYQHPHDVYLRHIAGNQGVGASPSTTVESDGLPFKGETPSIIANLDHNTRSHYFPRRASRPSGLSGVLYRISPRQSEIGQDLKDFNVSLISTTFQSDPPSPQKVTAGGVNTAPSSHRSSVTTISSGRSTPAIVNPYVEDFSMKLPLEHQPVNVVYNTRAKPLLRTINSGEEHISPIGLNNGFELFPIEVRSDLMNGLHVRPPQQNLVPTLYMDESNQKSITNTTTTASSTSVPVLEAGDSNRSDMDVVDVISNGGDGQTYKEHRLQKVGDREPMTEQKHDFSNIARHHREPAEEFVFQYMEALVLGRTPEKAWRDDSTDITNDTFDVFDDSEPSSHPVPTNPNLIFPSAPRLSLGFDFDVVSVMPTFDDVKMEQSHTITDDEPSQTATTGMSGFVFVQEDHSLYKNDWDDLSEHPSEVNVAVSNHSHASGVRTPTYSSQIASFNNPDSQYDYYIISDAALSRMSSHDVFSQSNSSLVSTKSYSHILELLKKVPQLQAVMNEVHRPVVTLAKLTEGNESAEEMENGATLQRQISVEMSSRSPTSAGISNFLFAEQNLRVGGQGTLEFVDADVTTRSVCAVSQPNFLERLVKHTFLVIIPIALSIALLFAVEPRRNRSFCTRRLNPPSRVVIGISAQRLGVVAMVPLCFCLLAFLCVLIFVRKRIREEVSSHRDFVLDVNWVNSLLFLIVGLFPFDDERVERLVDSQSISLVLKKMYPIRREMIHRYWALRIWMFDVITGLCVMLISILFRNFHTVASLSGSMVFVNATVTFFSLRQKFRQKLTCFAFAMVVEICVGICFELISHYCRPPTVKIWISIVHNWTIAFFCGFGVLGKLVKIWRKNMDVNDEEEAEVRMTNSTTSPNSSGGLHRPPLQMVNTNSHTVTVSTR